MKTWDQSVFDSTLKDYSQVSKRTHQVIVNTKAFYVARKAVWFTHKADIQRVKNALGQIISVNRITKAGKIAKRKTVILKQGRGAAPLAALMISKRLASAGKRSPFYGRSRSAGAAAMTRMVMKLMRARARSVAFLKSGWLPAIKKLAPYADKGSKPPIDNAAKIIGRDKGTAKPALATTNPVAEIINLATTRRDRKGALVKYGAPGLQRAFDDEAKSMVSYIEAKMAKDAARWNAQQARLNV